MLLSRRPRTLNGDDAALQPAQRSRPREVIDTRSGPGAVLEHDAPGILHEDCVGGLQLLIADRTSRAGAGAPAPTRSHVRQAFGSTSSATSSIGVDGLGRDGLEDHVASEGLATS
jgi:hypothetical protein